MTNWTWVDSEVVLAIHDEQLAEHGGATGVRDVDGLESALARAANLASYGNPDVAALAASYAFGIARNHPFVDGNKRTAYVVAELFLALNGMGLIASDASAVLNMLALASGEIGEDEFAAWLRDNIRPR